MSLLEVLITLGVLALALGMVAAAVRQYTRLLARNDARSLTVVHQQQVSQVADELSQAVELMAPAVAGSFDEVTFRRVNPNVTNRFPLATAPPTPSWDPAQPAHLVTVRYHYEPTTQRLQRTVTFPPGLGSQQTWVVGTSLSGFTVIRDADRGLTVGLSFLEGDVLKSLATRVNWWLRWP